jgi:hypothetical protein
MTFKEIARTTAGAVMSVVIVAWLTVFALAFLSVRQEHCALHKIP